MVGPISRRWLGDVEAAPGARTCSQSQGCSTASDLSEGDVEKSSSTEIRTYHVDACDGAHADLSALPGAADIIAFQPVRPAQN